MDLSRDRWFSLNNRLIFDRVRNEVRQSQPRRYIGDFEDAVSTLQINNPLDLSDTSSLAIGGYKQSVQTATVQGSDYDVELLSNSEVSEFSFDEENKKLSFSVDSASTGGATVEVGTVLEGPYVVSIDGSPAGDKAIMIQDETTGKVLLTISYEQGAHDIEVQGTTVVPEYPLAILVVVVAMAAVLVGSRAANKLSIKSPW